MRIINREEFLKLGAGTVFCKYVPCAFGDLQLKCDDPGQYGNDFVTIPLTGDIWIQGANNSEEYFEALTKAEEGKISIRADYEGSSRDGIFEEDQLFCIWDKEDIGRLISTLQKSL